MVSVMTNPSSNVDCARGRERLTGRGALEFRCDLFAGRINIGRPILWFNP